AHRPRPSPSPVALAPTAPRPPRLGAVFSARLASVGTARRPTGQGSDGSNSRRLRLNLSGASLTGTPGGHPEARRQEVTMRKLASIQTVNAVEPIPNADAIEKIRVLGWWVVVKKGEHRPGEKVVYCEIDSFLPERPEFEFLRASSYKPAQTDVAA